ncbi:MAG TPA: hypothetical protein VMW69_12815 [Spirochaetia bacterium]|nr:hypothetical protein [Spirochaetia bacterium]
MYLYSMADIKKEYQPGVCNIGAAERRTRLIGGWIGLAVTLVLWAAFLLFRIAAPWRLFLFLPAMMSASGFLQARMSFCVNFGMRGVENFGDRVGKITVIEDPESKKRDRSRSYQITGYSAIIAAAIAIAGLLVP